MAGTTRSSKMDEPTPLSAASGSGGESPIERAFRLLQTVVAAGESVGVRELSRRSGLPRSTVSRLIGTLADLGMVARSGDGSVVPGSALATLQPDSTSTLLRDALRPLLAELAQTFGENAALSVDDGDALLYLVQVRADNAVSVPDVSDERHEFHLVAPGLMTMAWWPTERLDAFLATALSAPTSHSVVDINKLRQRVGQIRTDGFAWTDQELDIGVNGLAVPVFSGPPESTDRDVQVTVSLFGPSYRFAPEVRPSLATDVIAMVDERAASLQSRQS